MGALPMGAAPRPVRRSVAKSILLVLACLGLAGGNGDGVGPVNSVVNLGIAGGSAGDAVGAMMQQQQQQDAAAVPQPYGQFTPITDRTPSYGSWGGRWAPAPPSDDGFVQLPPGFGRPSTLVSHTGTPDTVNVPANSFDQGYCVPRQAFAIVNYTALSCNPGSNLTKWWDGSPVCARIDCDYKPDGGNVIYAASFCRTVVQPARIICPKGCDPILQNVTVNASTDVTREVTRCYCRAGNQPCPGSWAGCVCQPPPGTWQNASSAYVVCSSQQSMCNNWCTLTANSLGPLCPVVPDASLDGPDAPSGPAYPRWSWDLAQQGQATAAVAPGTPVGRRLRSLGWQPPPGGGGDGWRPWRRWAPRPAALVRRAVRGVGRWIVWGR